jgi:hypothetical protein
MPNRYRGGVTEKPDPTLVGRERREAARARDLAALLQQRPDLAGVHPPADFAAESVRWCA